jgi:hypothetical protein
MNLLDIKNDNHLPWVVTNVDKGLSFALPSNYTAKEGFPPEFEGDRLQFRKVETKLVSYLNH